MADNENGGGGWTAFLAGIILVAVIGFGVFAYTGGFAEREVAEMQVELPDVDIDTPEINLPAPPPAPQLPPTASEDIPQPTPTTP